MRPAGDTTKVVVSSGQQRRPALSRRAGPRRRASHRCRRGRRRGLRRSQQRRAGRRRAPRRRGRALRRRGRGRRRSLGLPREHRKHRRPHQRTQTRAEGWRGWRLQAGSSISHLCKTDFSGNYWECLHVCGLVFVVAGCARLRVSASVWGRCSGPTLASTGSPDQARPRAPRTQPAHIADKGVDEISRNTIFYLHLCTIPLKTQLRHYFKQTSHHLNLGQLSTKPSVTSGLVG